MSAAASKIEEPSRSNKTDRFLHRLIENSSFVREYVWKYRKLVGLGLTALLIVDFLEILPPILLMRSVDAIIEQRPEAELIHLALIYFGICFIQGFCRYAWRMFLIRSSFLAGKDMRERFTHHLFQLSVSFFEKRRVGDLLSLATNDTESVRMAIGAGLLTLADALIYLMMVPVAMWLLSPKLTVISLLPLAFVPWFVMQNERRFHDRFTAVQNSFSKISAMAQENLNGMRVVKAYAVENIQLGRFEEAGKEFIELNLKLSRTQSIFGPILDFSMSTGLILLLWLGGATVIEGAITLGTFVAFQRFIQKLIWPMTAVGLAITMYQRAAASTARLRDILAIQSDVQESKTPQLPPEAGATGWRTAGRIEFKNLSFSYSNDSETSKNLVLKKISLTIEPGERIAFVGGIGSGKSTLLSLIPRLYPVADGMISLDGIDLNHWPLHELRRQIGYVSQDIFLFGETVEENLAYGLAELEPMESIREYTRIAAIHEEILKLSNGYATPLGERGVNLSGGQKQRLTIARALSKNPSILILDDALSSVDTRTEESILHELINRRGRNTELIAAHRISTIREADRIVVLEKGEVTQLGSHSELLKQASGLYARFHEQQKLKEDLESYVSASIPENSI